ncbi:MAG: hypothetical protein JXQ29_05100 [Planctomycetes bacterium]|nr:hypothetical protein [Planctomycetota bacterium]
MALKEELFLQALDEVRRRQPGAETGAGLRGVKLRDWSGSTLHLEVPHEFVRGLFERAVRLPLESALLGLTGSVVRVRLHVAADDGGPHRRDSPAARSRPSSLADFIQDENNRVVFRLVTQYLKGNPLFDPFLVHGPAAAGKTHLLRGFVELCKRDGESGSAAYFTGSVFGRAFRATSYRRRLDAFRAEVDRPRILVIDGLDRLGTMPATQRELVRLLERRQARGHVTLFAAREHPLRLEGLEDALRSRLLGGMVVRMMPVSLAAVQARVKAGLAKRGVRIEDGVLGRAVELSGGHPVAAETMILRAVAVARAEGRAVRAAELEPPERPAPGDGPDWTRIEGLAAEVAAYFAVSVADLRSPRKVHRAMDPRRFLVVMLRRSFALPAADIGQYLGGRSVSTVAALQRQGTALLAEDPALRELADQLQTTCHADVTAGH